MPLTALFIVDDADCTLTVLGVSIVEFQIGRARSAGATHAVLMVGRMPQSLHGVIDRLRREGLGIDVARNVADAMDFVHPDDRVLLGAPRVAIPEEALHAMADGTEPSALAIISTPENVRLDIIDGARRWTGWAAFDGRFLRDVGVTIGDWDLAPTILRKMLQAGCETPITESPVAMLDQADDRHALEARLRDAARGQGEGLGDAVIVLPAAHLASRLAGDTGLRPEWIDRGGYGVALGLAGAGLAGLIALPAILMIGALILWQTAETMNRALSVAPVPRWTRWAKSGLVAVFFVSAGFAATNVTGQWGCLVLAMVLAGLLHLLYNPSLPSPRAQADSASSLGIIGVVSMFGFPAVGLGLATVHAALSVAVRHAGKGAPLA